MGWEADRARDAAESMSWAEQQAALEECDAYERDRWHSDVWQDNERAYDDGNGMLVNGVYDDVEGVPVLQTSKYVRWETAKALRDKERRVSSNSRKRALEIQLKAIAEALAKIEARPKEPKRSVFIDEEELVPTILLNKKFNHNDTVYSYAFVGVAGRWYGTGPRAPKAYSWDELMDWLETTGPMPKIYRVQKSGVKLYWAPEPEDDDIEEDIEE